MAASTRSGQTDEDQKPTFGFEQLVLRLVVGVMLLVMLVVIVELGQAARAEAEAYARSLGIPDAQLDW
jgi:hypothetical protein